MIIPVAQIAPVAPVLSRWRRSSLAETVASDHVSAGCYRGSENVVIKAVVVSELKFRDVQRHVLAADLVERADDAALEDAPKALNRLSVNRADNVLMLGMVNGAVVEFLAKMVIANPLIGAEQTNLLRHRFVNESLQGRLLHVVK
jgi:hypothetical protein